jgi:hypothetical protein
VAGSSIFPLLGLSGQGVPESQIRREYTASSALGVFISPQDGTDMVQFLCSTHGAKITGQVVGVDGYVESYR